jgi:hypothetical protein
MRWVTLDCQILRKSTWLLGRFSVPFLQQLDRRLDDQQLLSDAILEGAAHARFDGEAGAVLPSGEIDPIQTCAALTGIEPIDTAC